MQVRGRQCSVKGDRFDNVRYFIGLFVEVGYNQDCFVLPFAVDVLPPVLAESMSVNQF